MKSPTCWLNLFPSVSSSCWSLRVRGHFQRTVSIHTFQFNLDTLGNWSVLFGKNSSYVRLSRHSNHNLFIRFSGDNSEWLLQHCVPGLWNINRTVGYRDAERSDFLLLCTYDSKVKFDCLKLWSAHLYRR